ncbi:MAG: Gar1/Naf1 family protein [Candidatus Bathyarchaeota archaeon]|nr:Gar1/Naf1 family protein [Candidatus Bathyarchaeota archaeon]
MHRIGHVLHVSSTKNVIVKAENIPRIGDDVTNENLKPVGTVFDVFGPTSSPYVAVKPHIQNPEQLINNVLYASPSKSTRPQRRKR